MAIVQRSYAPVGPTDAMLDRFVDANAAELAINTAYPQIVVTIDVDNAITDLIPTLDAYMTSLGYAVTAAAGSGKQVFQYIATGAEANPFTVAFPAARLSTNYNVQITMGGPAANAFKDFRALVSSFTINGFDIELGAAIDAGDIFMITVEDLT